MAEILEGETLIWQGRPTWKWSISFLLKWGLVGLLPLIVGILLGLVVDVGGHGLPLGPRQERESGHHALAPLQEGLHVGPSSRQLCLLRLKHLGRTLPFTPLVIRRWMKQGHKAESEPAKT